MQRGDLIPRQAAPWASCSRGLASSDRAPGNGLPVQRDHRQPAPSPGKQDHEIQTVPNRPGRACGRTRSRTVPSLTLVTRTWA